MNCSIKVVVAGANGKMGREIMKGLIQDENFDLVGALDINNVGKDVGDLIGGIPIGVKVVDDLNIIIDEVQPDVIVDFTRSDSARKNVSIALQNGVSAVIGTTGLTEEDLNNFDSLAQNNNIGAFFAPNFSLGAVVMMKYAREISRFFEQVEIIEYHNDKKVDSPSGTALATAQSFLDENGESKYLNSTNCKDSDSRGLDYKGVRVHSVRMKSLVAHQEIMFAGCGELLTIRHDSFSRESFLPGIKLALSRVKEWQGLKRGLDTILD